MRLLPSYRAARRNATDAETWRRGPFNAINERVKRLNLSVAFKTYTIVHSSYGRSK